MRLGSRQLPQCMTKAVVPYLTHSHVRRLRLLIREEAPASWWGMPEGNTGSPDPGLQDLHLQALLLSCRGKTRAPSSGSDALPTWAARCCQHLRASSLWSRHPVRQFSYKSPLIYWPISQSISQSTSLVQPLRRIPTDIMSQYLPNFQIGLTVLISFFLMANGPVHLFMFLLSILVFLLFPEVFHSLLTE